ncbi:MAG: NAD(P)H-hydrate dehydratase [Pseudomonadota bacterium]
MTQRDPGAVHEIGAVDAAAVMKPPGHKYDHGHAWVLAGPAQRTGAARLAARGALRIGAGLVTLGAPGASLLECATQTSAVMVRRCDDGAALAEAFGDTRVTAVCLGPGLGVARAPDLVAAALRTREMAVVLDADALTAFEADPTQLFDMLHPRVVLTPHAGEFRRLFPDIHSRLAAGETSKVDATRAAAARAGCTVLLKGIDTVIADQTGAASVHMARGDRAVPWLATAGAGDVLAGFIAGLFARGFAPRTAAEAAAWLHVSAALEFGPGLIAEDLPDALPAVLRRLAR